MNLEVFKSAWWEQTLFSCECQSVTSNLFGWVFVWPRTISLYVCADQWSAEYLSGNPLQTSKLSLLVQFSLFFSLCPKNRVLRKSVLAVLASSDSQLCILNSLSSPGSAWAPLLCAVAWKFSQGSQLGQL